MMNSDTFAPLMRDDALFEVYCHGYQAFHFSRNYVADAAAAATIMLDDDNATRNVHQGDSRHCLNLAPTDPQTEIKWDPAKLHSKVGGHRSFVEFFCGPLHVNTGRIDADGDPIGGFVCDPNVFIRYFNGHYAMFFSTCTPIGPRFWSRLFARESAAARAPEWFSAAIPLDVRHQIISYRFLIQTLAASVLQGFATGIKARWLYRRAQRRRLLKLALLRPYVGGSSDGELLAWRLKATPELIWAKILSYL